MIIPFCSVVRIGNRGPYRWSFGASAQTGHLMHIPEWAELVDLPTVTPILTEIFGEIRKTLLFGNFCIPSPRLRNVVTKHPDDELGKVRSLLLVSGGKSFKSRSQRTLLSV